MKNLLNKIAPFLGAVSMKPLQSPLSFFLCLSAASLIITHWTEIKLQHEFWLEWSVCLSANLVTISTISFLSRAWIPPIIQAPSARNVFRAIVTWMLVIAFCSISMHAHELQYRALTKFTNDIHTFPFMVGASMAITALTITTLIALLAITLIAPYRCIFMKEKN